jgi:stage IV sporulation protein FB
MSDLMRWSIDLGRWGGTRVRVHVTLVFTIVLSLLFSTTGETPRFVPTLAWCAVYLLVLALHEVGHAIAAAWQQEEAEDILLWPLGNLISPTRGRGGENPVVLSGGLVVNGVLAVVTGIGLGLCGARMMLSPFGGDLDSGAPTLFATGLPATPLTPLWYFGWFGWLNWLLFLINMLPALPLDMGRVLRATIARQSIGISRDAMIGPWAAHTVAAVLVLAAVIRLLFFGRLDSINLVILAFVIEAFVRIEARMLEDGSFFDEGAFGYDFSEGYTSLESSAAKVRPYRESALKRWRRRRSELRKQRREAQFAAEDRRLDEILDKIHHHGKAALTDEEQRFLVRVSSHIRKRPRDRA